MEMRRNKRYKLRAAVSFAFQQTDGSSLREEGYTRDISAAGVFVLTAARLASGTPVSLEVILPSLSEKPSGTFLRTQGRVVRLEETGFAAFAEMEFRLQFAHRSSSADSLSKRGGNGEFKAGSKRNNALRIVPISRSWM